MKRYYFRKDDGCTLFLRLSLFFFFFFQSTSSLDTKLDRLKSETEDNQSKSDDNLSEQDTTKQESTNTTNAKKVDSESDATNIATTPASCATPTSDAESSKKSESSSLAGAGPHPLLDQVKSLIGTSKPDREMKIDPEGKQLQIDDLIIIPNNLAATPPEGGSALQNLAKIASRYQNQKAGPEESGNSSQEASAAKKPKLDGSINQVTPLNKPPPVAATPPAASMSAAASSAASLAALAAMNPAAAMSPAQQQNLLSMLPPGLFMPPSKATPSGGVATPPPSSKSAAGSSAAAAMASLFPPGLCDPSKLGPEALQLLQLYEKTLKAVVQATPTKTNSSSSPKPRNASGSSSNAGSPQLQSAKDRDRNKVNRLPLDAKKPPAPQGHTPCAFAQSSSIYTNPMGTSFFKNTPYE